ncbi:N-acetyltransferase [Bacteroidia bacterium]|nr:N-acetyltransferase [Bacteroidia bacterium]
MHLLKECESIALSQERQIIGFNCGNDDLNEFFNRDAVKYQEQLMCQTYFFRHNETGKAVCAFSLSADSLKAAWLPGSRRKKVKELIPREKDLQSYPAFLIGRLGVAVEFGSQGTGTQLMDFIKNLCFDRYPNLARFLLVDAYNDPAVLQYYRKNGFVTVFSVEEQERDYYKRPDGTEPLRTRFMYYDMKQWKNKG